MTNPVADAIHSIDKETLNAGHMGLPAWAWPVIGFSAGLLLLAVVHGTCFVDPNCG